MHVCTQTACILDVTILTLWEVNLFTEHFFFFLSQTKKQDTTIHIQFFTVVSPQIFAVWNTGP